MLEQLENGLEKYFQPQGDLMALAIQVLIFAVILLIAPLFYTALPRY